MTQKLLKPYGDNEFSECRFSNAVNNKYIYNLIN